MLAACVLSPGFLASYWSPGFGTFLQVSALASHWMEDCANFTPTPYLGKWQIQRQKLLVQYKQQANLLLSMHNYTPLVIRGNFKKTFNIIKPVQTLINCQKYTFCVTKSLELLTNWKTGRVPYVGVKAKTITMYIKAKSISWDSPF